MGLSDTLMINWFWHCHFEANGMLPINTMYIEDGYLRMGLCCS